MNRQPARTRAPGWMRILAPPFVILAIVAATMLLTACGEEDQAQQEQPRRDVAVAQQQQQQQAMQQQAMQQQQEMQQQEVAYQQEQQQQAAAEYDAQQQAQQESMEQQAMEQQEEEAQASSSSSRSRSQQREQRSSEQRATPRRSLPGATNFEDYATTGWRETVDDDTSTFSLDVDRTSYFLALNWVEAGYAIEPASVRVEEWINAFNYGYELPDTSDSFAITTDILEHPLHDDLHLVRIATQAPEFVDNTPLNVTLVIDASGSMREGNRINIAKAAAESIRRGLSRDDRLAVVLFSDSVFDYAEHHRPNDRDLTRVIDNLYPRSSTNVQAGLNLGVEFADDIRRERPDAYNYVILMSDGVANVDATDPFAILRSAEDHDASNPLRLITVGVGIANYNDVLLEQLAQYGNGWYRYLQDVGQARSTFSRENWLALSIPFADQAPAQVRWNDESVLAWRLVGYENRVTSDRSFEQDRKEFAEIPMGSATTMFFEVELTTDAVRQDIIDLGEIELRWLVPMSDDGRSQQVQMVSGVSSFGDDAMLDLGSIVALAADRYSWFGQDGLSEETMYLAADHLDEIAYWYEDLPLNILNSQAGEDFANLLFAMGAIADEHDSEDPGYSR